MPAIGSFSTLDGVVLGLCLLLAIRGARKGFAWQAVRTLGLIAGLWLAGQFHEPVGAWLDQRLGFLPTAATPLVGWGVILVGTWLLATFLAWMIRGVVRQGELTHTDRALGFGMGAVMGLAIATVFFVVYGRVASNERLAATLENSMTATVMARLVDVAQPVLPRGLTREWADTLETIRASASGSP